MLCEICHKNQASIHIQELVNGKKKSLHICSLCAAKKTQNDPLFNGINLAEMLYNLTSGLQETDKKNKKMTDSNLSDVKKLQCKCGWTSENLRKTGRLGCQECYKLFREYLDPIIKNMHKDSIHVGKKPPVKGKKGGRANQEQAEAQKIMYKLLELQKKLDALVQREEYEEAAKVRDEIIKLKKDNGLN